MKFKDNIDLQELEKYGFKLTKKMEQFNAPARYVKDNFSVYCDDYLIDMPMPNAEPYLYRAKNVLYDGAIEVPDLVYDLIKAGLLVKADSEKAFYQVTFYSIDFNELPNIIRKPIHSVIVDNKIEAEMLCKDFDSPLTKASYIEIEKEAIDSLFNIIKKAVENNEICKN